MLIWLASRPEDAACGTCGNQKTRQRFFLVSHQMLTNIFRVAQACPILYSLTQPKENVMRTTALPGGP